MLEECLHDLESRIFSEAEEVLFYQWKEFALGACREKIFSPQRGRSLPPSVHWPRISTNDALRDFKAMALQQYGQCSGLLSSAAGGLLCVRCNYGTGILPSVFGAELFLMDKNSDTLPTTRPLTGGREGIERLLDRGLPDIHAGLGARVLQMAEFYQDINSRFPQIGRWVHIYHPDLQGPMDVCEMLWGSSLFLDIWDHPETVKALLLLVTEAYTAFMRAWEEIVPPRGDGLSVHWSMLYKGHLMLRDDSAMNFSPAMYDEFIRPWDQKLFDLFDGGAIHFCGHGDHYIGSMGSMPGLSAIDMSQPELNDMKEILSSTVDRGVILLRQRREVVEALSREGFDLQGRVHCA